MTGSHLAKTMYHQQPNKPLTLPSLPRKLNLRRRHSRHRSKYRPDRLRGSGFQRRQVGARSRHRIGSHLAAKRGKEREIDPVCGTTRGRERGGGSDRKQNKTKKNSLVCTFEKKLILSRHHARLLFFSFPTPYPSYIHLLGTYTCLCTSAESVEMLRETQIKERPLGTAPRLMTSGKRGGILRSEE